MICQLQKTNSACSGQAPLSVLLIYIPPPNAAYLPELLLVNFFLFLLIKNQTNPTTEQHK